MVILPNLTVTGLLSLWVGKFLSSCPPCPCPPAMFTFILCPFTWNSPHVMFKPWKYVMHLIFLYEILKFEFLVIFWIFEFRLITCTTVTKQGHHQTPLYLDISDNLDYIDGLVQDCRISSVLALEILQSCTKPSILFSLLFCWNSGHMDNLDLGFTRSVSNMIYWPAWTQFQ